MHNPRESSHECWIDDRHILGAASKTIKLVGISCLFGKVEETQILCNYGTISEIHSSGVMVFHFSRHPAYPYSRKNPPSPNSLRLIPDQALLPFAYRLTIHPLARYPGPRLWALSRIPYVLSMRAGTLAHDIQAFHARYGPVVRLAPTELSFTDAAAAKDIYAGAHPFPKNPIWFSPPSSGRAASLLNAGPEDHARMRRAWGYGFSERALREQEPLIRDVVDQLVERLRQRAECGQEADMTTLFNYTVFDIVGSLAFGESFDCLANDAYHAWVGLIVFHFKTAVLMTACSYFPWLYRGLRLLVPASARAKQAEHFGRAQAKVRKRLAAKVDRPDLLAHLARSRKGLTEAEIEATAAQIIVAGSDTLTTTLTGTLSYLLRFPETMKRVQGEIRQAFEREEDIVLVRLEKLPYLGAVIDEGLRIVSPVPLGMSRVVPEGGGMVCGEVIAGGVSASLIFVRLFCITCKSLTCIRRHKSHIHHGRLVHQLQTLLGHWNSILSVGFQRPSLIHSLNISMTISRHHSHFLLVYATASGRIWHILRCDLSCREYYSGSTSSSERSTIVHQGGRSRRRLRSGKSDHCG